MCGIAGFVTPLERNKMNPEKYLQEMLSSINHRGPDYLGTYHVSIGNMNISLGHDRLSIIDISEKANQPMISEDGNYIICYNGEIYNYKKVKKKIEDINNDINWNTNSDTEVLLNGIKYLGLEQTLSLISGMFAFALLDKNNSKLYLVRDRLGEKPLYYTFQDNKLFFVSELKAFDNVDCVKRDVDYRVAEMYLKNGVVPGEYTIYKDIYKLSPGSYLSIDLNQFSGFEKIKPSFYWSLSENVSNNSTDPYLGSYEEALSDLEELLIMVVKEHAISDVPIGAFLSGGIDSSLICSIMKHHLNGELITFSIGMPYPGNNEALFAKDVAITIGSKHYEKYLDVDEIVSRIDEILEYWDEPFADSSQIPTFFVAELAKKHVTVSLSGDGADEFFFGYNNYAFYRKLRKYRFLNYLPISCFLKLLIRLFPGSERIPLFKRIRSFVLALKFNNIGALNLFWRNKFRGFELPIKHKSSTDEEFYQHNINGAFTYAGYYDAISYLTDDILVKVDRASMSVSLESRSPFIDSRVIDFVTRLPEEYKYHNGKTKRILKDILYKYIPEHIVNRPKQGFSIPVSHWLRNELYTWADDIITSIDEDSVFWDKSKVLIFWDEHINLKFDHGERLWSILILEKFFRRVAKAPNE